MMHVKTLMKLAVVLAGGALLASAPTPAAAAVLSLESTTRPTSTTPFNLTTLGPVDWAYWTPLGAVSTLPAAPTNERSVGNAINGANIVGGTALRGPTSSTTKSYGLFSYSDGTSPTSASNVVLGGLIFNSSLGNSAVGKGVSVSVAGDPAAERLATFFVGGFGSTGRLTLSLNGATSIVAPTQTFDVGDKQTVLYQVRYRPDAAGDLLTAQFVATAVSDATNGHVGLQAVTVALVPEPGALAVLAAGGLLLARSRRRRTA